MIEETVVITRHRSLVQYLIEIGLITADTVVFGHADAAAVRGKHVIGVLPHKLSALALAYTEVPLEFPQELRGAELTLEQVRMYARKPRTYIVKQLDIEYASLREKLSALKASV